MQVQEAINLRKEWGYKPCEHPVIVKEYDKGAATGDSVCKTCGQSGWGSEWNNPKKDLSLCR